MWEEEELVEELEERWDITIAVLIHMLQLANIWISKLIESYSLTHNPQHTPPPVLSSLVIIWVLYLRKTQKMYTVWIPKSGW